MPEGRSIDHVVVAVDDLDIAAASYEALGFKLTPRAQHPDRMGTSNRLIQFGDRNYIELLEVDRPGGIDPHAFDAVPPRFSFGAHNKAFVRQRSGMSMLVLATTDARADLEQFAALGLETYAPFDFERKAQLSDGSRVTVAFTLGFVTSPGLPGMAFFVCQHHTPQYFWKPEYQSHGNRAQAIAAVYIASRYPSAHIEFLAKLTGGTVEGTVGGQRISCGRHELFVVTPERIRTFAADFQFGRAAGPRFAGVAISSEAQEPQVLPAERAGGVFIEWRRG